MGGDSDLSSNVSDSDGDSKTGKSSSSESSQEDYADRLKKKERWFKYVPLYLDDSKFG
jgi:hypothetical protein